MRPAIGYTVTVIKDGIITHTGYDDLEFAMAEVNWAMKLRETIEVNIKIVAEIKNGS